MNKFECEIEFQDMVIANLRARSGMSYAHLSNIKNGKVKHVKLETIQNESVDKSSGLGLPSD